MHPSPRKTAPILITAAALALSACSDSTGPELATPDAAHDEQPATPQIAETTSPLVVLDVPDPDSVYDPVRAGEPLPDGFRQVLGRDEIAPVYDPRFAAAAGVGWPEDSLVIGVDLEGEARAYPVGFLNRREIVNDNHRGIPTLVTW